MQLRVRCDCGTVVQIARPVVRGEPLSVRCPGCEEQLVVGAAEWADLTQVGPQPPAGFAGLICAHTGRPGGAPPA